LLDRGRRAVGAPRDRQRTEPADVPQQLRRERGDEGHSGRQLGGGPRRQPRPPRIPRPRREHQSWLRRAPDRVPGEGRRHPRAAPGVLGRGDPLLGAMPMRTHPCAWLVLSLLVACGGSAPSEETHASRETPSATSGASGEAEAPRCDATSLSPSLLFDRVVSEPAEYESTLAAVLAGR